MLEVTHSEREDDSVAFPEQACETPFTRPSILHSRCRHGSRSGPDTKGIQAGNLPSPSFSLLTFTGRPDSTLIPL